MLRDKSRRFVGVARAAARDPFEARERVLERIDEWKGHRRPPAQPPIVNAWEQQFHELLGAPWPCPAHAEFAALYDDVTTSLEEQGLRVGRGEYGGWDDGDGSARANCMVCDVAYPTRARDRDRRRTRDHFARRARSSRTEWLRSLVEHRHPAAHRDGPAGGDRRRGDGTVAYPVALSRRIEPATPAQAPVDSWWRRPVRSRQHAHHPERHLRARPGLARAARRGAVVVDDVERNSGFAVFGRGRRDWRAVAGMADDDRALVGVAVKADQAPAAT